MPWMINKNYMLDKNMKVVIGPKENVDMEKLDRAMESRLSAGSGTTTDFDLQLN